MPPILIFGMSGRVFLAMTNKEAYQVVLGQIEHDMEHKPDYTISKQEQDYWDELKEAYDIIFNNFILIKEGYTLPEGKFAESHFYR